jgi:hypothetical protein
MRMLEQTGKISNDRDMNKLLNSDKPLDHPDKV